MGKLKDQLAGIAALIGVLGAIGAGFVKYGEMQEQLSSLGALDIDPLVKEIAGQNVKISVLEKTIEVLELEIKELKQRVRDILAPSKYLGHSDNKPSNHLEKGDDDDDDDLDLDGMDDEEAEEMRRFYGVM